MPRIIVFDAVGTVITTRESVYETYFRFGNQAGSAKTIEEIRSSFSSLRTRYFNEGKSVESVEHGQLVSSDDIEKHLWFLLVKATFDDVAQPRPMFESLWNYFADPDSWTVYPDTLQCWSRLKASGHQIVIGSNFDGRLQPVMEALSGYDLVDHVFFSAEIGVRKPDPSFYEQVQSRLHADDDSLKPSDFLMIGDSLENDCLAPLRWGWQAIWLDRSRQWLGERQTFASVPIRIVHSLDELLTESAPV